MPFYRPSCFEPLLVICEPFLGRQAGHTHIHAGLSDIAIRVFESDAADFADSRIQQHHVNVVMVFWRLFAGVRFQSAAPHALQFAGFRGLPSSKTTLTSTMLTPKTGQAMAFGNCRRFRLLAQTENHILGNGILASLPAVARGGY